MNDASALEEEIENNNKSALFKFEEMFKENLRLISQWGG